MERSVVTLDKLPSAGSTGVLSYDVLKSSIPLAVREAYPTSNGLGAIRLPPQSGDVEIASPAAADHAVWLLLSKPKAMFGGIDKSPRALSTQTHSIGVMPAGAPTFWRFPHGDVDAFHLDLSPERLMRTLGEDGAPADIELRPALAIQDEALAGILLNCLAELGARGLASRVLVETYATLAAVHLLRAHSNVILRDKRINARSSPPTIRRAQDFIESHLHDNIGLDAIADAAGLSPFHFARTFKKSTGQSPYRYLTVRRIERAKRMMQMSNDRLVEIALSCGFASQQHFTTAFRKEVGVSPAAWRRDARK